MKTVLCLALSAALLAGPALADPPQHAPAWGYHGEHPHKDKHKKHKHDKRYKGKTGAVYVRDYGILSGRCNRDEIGAVIGGVAGAAVGSQVVDREDRVVGMVVGGVLGAILGHAIGDAMDDKDRACMGQALELGRPGVPVVWESGKHRYHFIPGDDVRDGCRQATLSVDGRKPRDVLACPRARGEWEFRKM